MDLNLYPYAHVVLRGDAVPSLSDWRDELRGAGLFVDFPRVFGLQHSSRCSFGFRGRSIPIAITSELLLDDEHLMVPRLSVVFQAIGAASEDTAALIEGLAATLTSVAGGVLVTWDGKLLAGHAAVDLIHSPLNANSVVRAISPIGLAP